MKFEIFDRFAKNIQISNFKKIRPVRADFFHAEGRTDRHDEANNRFLRFSKAPESEEMSYSGLSASRTSLL